MYIILVNIYDQLVSIGQDLKIVYCSTNLAYRLGTVLLENNKNFFQLDLKKTFGQLIPTCAKCTEL